MAFLSWAEGVPQIQGSRRGALTPAIFLARRPLNPPLASGREAPAGPTALLGAALCCLRRPHCSQGLLLQGTESGLRPAKATSSWIVSDKGEPGGTEVAGSQLSGVPKVLCPLPPVEPLCWDSSELRPGPSWSQVAAAVSGLGPRQDDVRRKEGSWLFSSLCGGQLSSSIKTRRHPSVLTRRPPLQPLPAGGGRALGWHRPGLVCRDVRATRRRRLRGGGLDRLLPGRAVRVHWGRRRGGPRRRRRRHEAPAS